MITKRYITGCLFALALLITACSTEEIEQDVVNAESREIQLNGLARSGYINKTKLFVKAFYSGGAFNPYFQDTPITVDGGLEEGVIKNITFPGGTPYYPLGQAEIVLFGFTGNLYQGDKMVLKAGLGDNFDSVLSNYGQRDGDGGINKNYQPTGTPGSSNLPAEVLQFRHVMTQLIVDIQIDEIENPPVDTKPTVVKFRMPGVVAQGYYPIRSHEPDPVNEAAAEVAETPTGSYEIRLGTNYLVPTGIDLADGRRLTELIIDDYTATGTDLGVFEIEPLGSQTTMKLLPGYSYNLTFTINRLGIQSIRIRQIEWQTVPVGSEVSYDPYKLALSLNGGYVNADDDAINKVVLHTADRIYVGKMDETTADSFDFVTLPSAGEVTQVELFTAKGLLLSSPITTTDYDGSTLTMQMSPGGMLLANAGQANSEDNPYLITTPVQFMNVSKQLGAHYRQMATIDLNTLNLIGADRIFNGFDAFSGTYDGNGQGIDGLDIEGPGLFVTNNGTLKNIRIYSGTMDASGQTYAGALCGTNNGTIVASFNESRLANGTGTIGGICGLNAATGQVIACLNTGTILQGANVGGIVGENQNTAEGAISACINTGMLNPAATMLGFICGTSAPSANNVIHVSFGLVGSAQRVLGGNELVVGSDNVDYSDSSVLYPEILRNGLFPGEGEERRVITRLNNEIQTTPWAGIYHYILDREATGSTWPVPVKE